MHPSGNSITHQWASTNGITCIHQRVWNLCYCSTAAAWSDYSTETWNQCSGMLAWCCDTHCENSGDITRGHGQLSRLRCSFFSIWSIGSGVYCTEEPTARQEVWHCTVGRIGALKLFLLLPPNMPGSVAQKFCTIHHAATVLWLLWRSTLSAGEGIKK